MTGQQNSFKLPREIDRFLAALSKFYAKADKRQLQEIIVNAKTRVREGSSHDNWNGGIDGHAVYLKLPSTIFLSVVEDKVNLQNQIKTDLNRLHSSESEFFDEVFLEIEVSDDHEWRK